MVNKLLAPRGTLALVAWPEVTAWAACGWQVVGTRRGQALLRRR